MKYERPDTRAARDRLAASGGRLHVPRAGRSGRRDLPEAALAVPRRQLRGQRAEGLAGAGPGFGALGGEVSSWGAFEEFLLGKLQIPEAVYSVVPLVVAGRPQAEQRQHLLPEEVRRLARAVGDGGPDAVRGARHRVAFEQRAARRRLGPVGLASGAGFRHGLPYAIGDPARGPGGRRRARRPGSEPTRVALPVTGRWASLLFLHAATAEGRPPIHAGDFRRTSRASRWLLGYYEMRYADEFVSTHEIRCGERRALERRPLARLLPRAPRGLGQAPDGRDAVLWASEWVNPHPGRSARLPSALARPSPPRCPFGVTAVEKPRVEDYR